MVGLLAVVVLLAFLAVCFGLGEWVYGWPMLRCHPPQAAVGVAAAADRDPTGCGYAYRAIGVGLGLGLALAIGIGQLAGSVWVGLGTAIALGVAGGGVRFWKQWRTRAAAAQHEVLPPDAAAACDKPTPLGEPDWVDSFAGPRRPVLRRDHLWVLGAVLATFVFILGGGLRTTQLYDPDGNDHAVGVRWLMDHGELREPFPEQPVLHYIDAYPPGFDVAAAAMSAGLDGRVALPLKLLTALAAALAVGLLFQLVAELTARPRLALLAVYCFVLAPNNLTAFIWAHSLAFALLPLVAALQLRHLRVGGWREGAGAALALGAICLISPESGLKALPWAAIPVGLALVRRQWRGLGRLLLAGVAAGLVALIWWGPMFARYGSYQQLWRAQLAPVVVSQADQGQWQAPSLIQTAGSGDEALNWKVHFWGWDHIGLGSESPTLPLSLGWAQTVMCLMGLGGVLTQQVLKQGPRLRQPDGLGLSDGIMAAFLAYCVLGMLGPVTGLSLYAYRFVLYLTVPCAYFSARGLGLLWAAPGRVAVGAIGLVALATVGSLFGYGVWPLYAGYWLGLITLLVLMGSVLVGVAAARGVGGEPAMLVRGMWHWAAVSLVLAFAVYAGGVSRFWCNYTQKVPLQIVDSIGMTAEREVLDRLEQYLPRGSQVYPAGGRHLHRFVIAQEMRAPLFEVFDDAAWNREILHNLPAALARLRAAEVEFLYLGPSYAQLGLLELARSSSEQQQQVVRLQAAVDALPGVRRVVTQTAPNRSMAPTVIWQLPPR